MATHRRCNSPDHPAGEDRWHSVKDPCPSCGGAPIFNKALYTSMLNGHLHSQVSRQRDEVNFAKKAKKEREPR